jgi:hypothetical protein
MAPLTFKVSESLEEEVKLVMCNCPQSLSKEWGTITANMH